MTPREAPPRGRTGDAERLLEDSFNPETSGPPDLLLRFRMPAISAPGAGRAARDVDVDGHQLIGALYGVLVGILEWTAIDGAAHGDRPLGGRLWSQRDLITGPIFLLMVPAKIMTSAWRALGRNTRAKAV